MSKKIIDDEVLYDTHGPMNSVSKDDAEVWTEQSSGKDYNEQQKRRIIQAKKNQAKVSSKKQDRKISKSILKNVEEK
mgnify:FL=1|jgi:hypothetical protein|tara:strand:+ start:229 stop:459 length:231 start_codon:yes stop_codon:yes gene_type:complete